MSFICALPRHVQVTVIFQLGWFVAGIVCNIRLFCSRARKKIKFREVSAKCTFLAWDRSCRLLNPRIEMSGFAVFNREIWVARGRVGSGAGSSLQPLPSRAAPAPGAGSEVTLGVNRSAQQCGSLPFYVGTFLTVPCKQA